MTAHVCGLRIRGTWLSSVAGVSHFTNPTSSDSGLFSVKKLMTIVKVKQMSHAHHARQKFAA